MTAVTVTQRCTTDTYNSAAPSNRISPKITDIRCRVWNWATEIILCLVLFMLMLSLQRVHVLSNRVVSAWGCFPGCFAFSTAPRNVKYLQEVTASLRDWHGLFCFSLMCNFIQSHLALPKQRQLHDRGQYPVLPNVELIELIEVTYLLCWIGSQAPKCPKSLGWVHIIRLIII